MKKSRIFLASLAVCVIVGGAVAAKAKQAQTGNLFYCSAGNCVQSLIYSDVAGDETSVSPSLYYTGTSLNGKCNITPCNAQNPTQIFETED